ncbi:ScyD/ScyE family protein [Glaciihabitans sp. dw_435]|uniref:ScyD/ScyE family protein n=1 Tax=Glaciihabitans sp. dw_435 TaxID=2720081 RepID=UPI001BD3B07E|nr:ScyD/ScyE family protein [Glaciihabitans sp. dw_435]
MRKPLIATAACVALVGSTLLVASPASANGRGHSHHPTPPSVSVGSARTLADGLLSPLSLDVTSKGTAYVTENFGGTLVKVDRTGTKTTLASAPGDEISAVSSRNGAVYYAQLAQDHSRAVLKSISKAGVTTQLADIHAYEQRVNPDKKNTYGAIGLPASCAAQFPPPAPATYAGTVDTHPYASLATKRGIYVADAGANAIFKIGYNGAISTVAVLPAQPPITLTAELLTAQGLPTCAAGYQYRFEPVPTDVEQGANGWLYVTSLPGGPEDASLGARGGVYKVNPYTGAVKLVARGFVGATGLAVLPTGAVAVAELFGGSAGTGQVSIFWPGKNVAKKTIALSAPAAIERVGKKLYVTTDALPSETAPPNGKITVLPFRAKAGHR